MSTIVPNWAVTEVIASPNFDHGRSKPIEGIVIHHYGVDGVSHDGAIRTLCTRNSGGEVSAHYVVSAGRVTQLVSDRDTAFHCKGNNAATIGIECKPEMSAGDLETLAQLIAAIWSEHGYLPLSGHRDHFPTACPGRYYPQLAAIEARAHAIAGGAPITPVTTSTTSTTNSNLRGNNDMHLIATKLSDGSWSYALITENSGAKTLDANQRGAYIKMLGDAAGYPWDWYWMLIREAWERRNALIAAMGAEADEAADSIVARLQAGMAPAEEA